MAAPKFNSSAQDAIQAAQAEAIRREHQELTPEHLLFALLDADSEEMAIVPNLLETTGVNVESLRSGLERALLRLPKVHGGGGQIYPSPLFSRLLVFAEDEAKKT